MLSGLLVIGLAIGMVAPTLAVNAQSRFTPKSVSVEMPTSDRLFREGPGSDAANAYCLACHSVGMVLTQPTLSRSTWEAEVNKMRTAYKAPIPDDQVQVIVSYLVGLKNSSQ